MSQEPKRTLVVDDLQSNRLLLKTLLGTLGCVTETAASGLEALEKLSPSIDLVLLDLMMPEMDGLEVTRLIRQHPIYHDLPIIIVTAMDSREDRLRAVEAGANDFIAKPVDPTELRIRTQSLLDMKAARDALKQHKAHLEQLVEQRTVALSQALNEVMLSQTRLLEAEREKKKFTSGVLRAVTGGKLHLVDAEELVAEGRLIEDVELTEPQDCRVLRKRVEAISQEAGMDFSYLDDLLLAVGEAAANAIKHTGAGHSAIYVSRDQVTVQIRDQGRGIQMDALPDSLLVPGFSTQISLGMGFTMMLGIADRLCLSTGPRGTVVQLEKALQPKVDSEERLLALMDRF